MLYKGKKVLVVGMAKSGLSAVKLLSESGAIVTINDSKSDIDEILMPYEAYITDKILGCQPEKIETFDLIVLSPGVPLSLPFIEKAKALNIPIIGEIELSYSLTEGQFIGITGTNGKTTTTALVGEIFSYDNRASFVVGNIGIPASSKVGKNQEKAIFITELSSFQLETIDTFKTNVSAILNLTPDHLNRHITMDAYIDAKMNIVKNATENDVLVLNYDDELTRNLAQNFQGKKVFFSRNEKLEMDAYLENGMLMLRTDDHKIYEMIHRDALHILGDHNVENALGAILIAYHSGVSIENIKRGLASFKGVEHRIEYVTTINGVKYYNDSKATNPDSSIAAIKAMNDKTHLIAGGMDKKSHFDELIDVFKETIVTLIVFGETKEIIKKAALEKGFTNIFVVDNLKQAVDKAYELANEDEVVLLSPACASWDMYPNFEVRGNEFKTLVKQLGGK